MKKIILGLSLLLGVAGQAASTETTIDVDVSAQSPFQYVVIGQIQQSDYNPWSNGIYIGYSGGRGYDDDALAIAYLDTPSTKYAGGVDIDSLESYDNSWYFYMELVAADGTSKIAYSDLVDYRTIQGAVQGGTVQPWFVKSYSVPEPTSGLLLLMGGALLGLRRKRRVA